MAASNDWVPIPPYAELQVRIKILQAEHMFVCKQYYWANDEFVNNIRIADEAIQQKCDPKQAKATKYKANAVLCKHMEAHELEKGRLEKLTYATREDMWDHNYMAERGHPSSLKRRRHFHAMCDPMPLAYTRKWVYEHLPSDVRAERRARALERWRKAAYLLSVLAFWKHETNKDGSKAARAALERVSKRARVD